MLINKVKKELVTLEPKERATRCVEVLSEITDQNKKIKLLKNLFRNEKCVIISCGPSILEQNREKLTNLLENNVVIAIKQAYELFPDLVDFHLFNCANVKKYSYADKKRPVIIEASSVFANLNITDLKFAIRERDFNNSVAKKKNFDDWTLANQTSLRPYGPGIMYELVFFVVQHLGFSEVTTVGWDNKLVSPDAATQHFYDVEQSEYRDEKFIDHNNVAANDGIIKSLTKEAIITSDAIMDWCNWLKHHGCEMKIISDLNPAPPEIQRVTL
jgi:hypothetical protein